MYAWSAVILYLLCRHISGAAMGFSLNACSDPTCLYIHLWRDWWGLLCSDPLPWSDIDKWDWTAGKSLYYLSASLMLRSPNPVCCFFFVFMFFFVILYFVTLISEAGWLSQPCMAPVLYTNLHLNSLCILLDTCGCLNTVVAGSGNSSIHAV